MKRLKMFLTILLMSVGITFAQKINIPVMPESPDAPNDGGSRSIVVAPFVALDNVSLNIDYPFPTISNVIIRDTETGAVVYSASYDATRQVVINLSILPEGTYEIRLYAFGKWWWGEFELEND